MRLNLPWREEIGGDAADNARGFEDVGADLAVGLAVVVAQSRHYDQKCIGDKWSIHRCLSSSFLIV